MSDYAIRALEFDRILQRIARHARSEASAAEVLALRPLGTRAGAVERQAIVAEARTLSRLGDPLRIEHFEALEELFDAVRPAASVLEPGEVSSFAPVLRTIAALIIQARDTEGIPLIKIQAEGLTGFPEILYRIERSIGPEGDILDSASPELAHIRARKRSLEARIRRRLEEILGDPSMEPNVQDEFITKRSGRWVIPVKMDFKGRVPGVVHDVSRTGETAFVEPVEIIGPANELENLSAEEKAEELRILRAICSLIRADQEEIKRQYRIVVWLDAVRAIAAFSDLLGMEGPEINDEGRIRLVSARHPLLLLLMREGRHGETVPLDLELGGEEHVMVITGPNAGGKTIAAKTAGLIVLMALTGIPVPADPSSTVPVIGDILVDIGDEQSIEQSLSTFSGHVANISRIMNAAGPSSMVILDELGTGTDPAEGAAIACAVLKALLERSAMVIATTHLTDIVGYVHRTDGMANASMEFDPKNMRPLYKLRRGEPGESHALDVAERYGLQPEIIASARQMMGGMKAELKGLLAELRQKRSDLDELMEKTRQRELKLAREEAIAKEKLASAEEDRKRILREALEEAKELLADVKRDAYASLEEVKRVKTRKSAGPIEKKQKEVEERLKEFVPDIPIPLVDINEGDTVFVRSMGYDARVVSIDVKKDRIRVRAGNMELEIPADDAYQPKGKTPAKKSGVVKSLETEGPHASSRIELIGMRVDEAIEKLEPYLNQASLSGMSEVSIIHGIGTGALMRGVREYLKGHPLVEEYHEDRPGVTLARLK